LSDIAVAALLAGTILIASMISVEIALAVALIELLAGVIVGNAFSLDIPNWLAFIGTFAGVVLTFQAGAEVDVPQFRREWRPSLAIGLASFFAPFAVVTLVAYYALGWNHREAEIGGLALSTTSLAVVYAVLVETGLNRELVGKRLMSATFVTDIATVIGLTVLFVKPTLWIVPFIAVSVLLIAGLPRVAPWFFSRYGDRVIEPEIKLVFASLFLLMWLGGRANSQAVLPAFVLGLAMSRHYAEHRLEQERLRVVAFAFLTPFFFVKGGMNVSLGALWSNLGILGVLVAGKMLPKLAAVYPLARRYSAPHQMFTTLLMSTGLTFGTITSLYGLNAGIIDRTKFSLLIAVVVLSAIVPTAIAQRWFSPRPRERGAIDVPVV
jgi:Kef-type K+ transport system membrane component KefB